MIDTTTKSVRLEVKALASRLGAAVTEDRQGRYYNVVVEAPRGHHWAGSGVHEIVGSCLIGPWSYAEVWGEVLGRMQEGVEPCTDECEWWT